MLISNKTQKKIKINKIQNNAKKRVRWVLFKNPGFLQPCMLAHSSIGTKMKFKNSSPDR